MEAARDFGTRREADRFLAEANRRLRVRPNDDVIRKSQDGFGRHLCPYPEATTFDNPGARPRPSVCAGLVMRSDKDLASTEGGRRYPKRYPEDR